MLRNAILSYGHLGIPNQDKTSLENYIHSLYDPKEKLFFSYLGAEAPSLKATSEALESLYLLSALNHESFTHIVSEIKSLLKESIKDEKNVKSFSISNTLDKSDYEVNIYSILASNFLELNLGDVKPFGNYFTLRQTRFGSVSSVTNNETLGTLQTTFEAVSALSALASISHSSHFVGQMLNEKSLFNFIVNIPSVLPQAYMAHYTISQTSLFSQIFYHQVTYEVINGALEGENGIVQGSSITPILRIAPFGQIVHSGLNIEAEVKHYSMPDRKIKLLWNPEIYSYTTDEYIDTSGKLGNLSITFSVGINIVGQSLSFSLKDVKSIGYHMEVKSYARIAGKEIKLGGKVSVGSEFNFAIELAIQETMLSGDFDLIFSVLDSSNVLVHETIKDCNENEEPLGFSFDLQRADLPSGLLTFRFQIKDKTTKIIHTERIVQYLLELTMVASQILFEDSYSVKPYFQLGDSTFITMVPASLPDLVTLHPYLSKDFNGVDISLNRTFYLDTYSGNTILKSYLGIPSTLPNGHIKYFFKIEFPSSLQSIGSHYISFRYEDTHRNSHLLKFYDSQSSELIDETYPFSLVVQSDLELIELLNLPKGGNISYGQEVSFSFKIKDKLSGLDVLPNSKSDSVFLSLSHQQPNNNQIFVSALHPATPNAYNYNMHWVISPDAIRGQGKLSIVAEVLGEQQITLHYNNKDFYIDLNIGGEIENTFNIYQMPSNDKFPGSIVVEFGLTCQHKKLKAAKLTAIVYLQNNQITSIPVARNDETGQYSISWTINKENEISGNYQIDVYRQVDIQISEQNHQKVDPLFVLPLNYVGAPSQIVPFRSESVVLLLIFMVFASFSFRKMTLEKLK